jgi:hypothetical protein
MDADTKREGLTWAIENERRRIDIVIDMGTRRCRFGIGIENKPWASEGEDQVSDYLDHLTRVYGLQSMLIFLAGHRQLVASLSDDRQRELDQRGRFRYITYASEIRRWLVACREVCRAKRVDWLLSSFVDYIDEQFGLADI